MTKIITITIFIFWTSFSSLLFGSEKYEDCILINMKGTGSDVAAKAIKDVCKAKHINSISSICAETEAQVINGIIYLPNMTEPFTGSNLCEYVNGQVKSKGGIKDGKFDGKSIWWYANGQRGLEKNYKDGKLDGWVTWWYDHIGLDGQIWSKKYYQDDKKDGKWTTWHVSGQIWSEEHYKDDKKDGKWTTWYASGQKWSEEHYKDNKKDGKSIWWYESGQIRSEEHYKDNKCISGNC